MGGENVQQMALCNTVDCTCGKIKILILMLQTGGFTIKVSEIQQVLQKYKDKPQLISCGGSSNRCRNTRMDKNVIKNVGVY